MHYDGIIWPEIKDNNTSANASVGYGQRAIKALFGFFIGKKESTSDSKKENTAAYSVGRSESTSDYQTLIDVKSLSILSHAEYRKKAITIYLNFFRDILYGPEPLNTPISIIRNVYAIYASLDSSYVYYDQQEDSWKFKETTEVCKLMSIIILKVSINVYILSM